MLLNFVIDKEGFRCTNANEAASATTANYIKCHFDLRKLGHLDAVVAVFKSATYNKHAEILLDSNWNCFVDPEVYRRGGTIQVKLIGDKYISEGVLSTTFITPITEFYIREDIAVPTETPSKYDIFVAELEKAEQAVEDVMSDLALKLANHEFDGPQGDPGTDGDDGFSPLVEFTEIEGGNRMTVEDANGTHSIDIMNGVDGVNGVDGLPGADGADGPQGAPGHSPVIAASKSGSTTTITSDGVAIATILDGTDGVDGVDGVDGEPGPTGVYYGSSEPTDPNVNLWVDSTAESLEYIISDILYPVGSIYETLNADFDPNDVWAGFWTKDTSQRVLIGAVTPGNSGGSMTHRLTVNELPSHTHVVPNHVHGISVKTSYLASGSAGPRVYNGGSTSANATYQTTPDSGKCSTGSAGGGSAFSIMPPYTTVCRWRRTA